LLKSNWPDATSSFWGAISSDADEIDRNKQAIPLNKANRPDPLRLKTILNFVPIGVFSTEY
jgi:hypothetical protein